MVQNASISEADKALADFFWKTVEAEPALKNVVSSREQIVFSSPKAPQKKGTRKLTIFLYNIVGETQVGKPASLELRYLVTPFTGKDNDDHALLEKITQAVSGTPQISSSDGEGSLRLNVRLDSVSLEELSRLWIALDAPLRPSVLLTVYSNGDRNGEAHLANAPPQLESSAETQNAIQLYNAVQKTFTEQSEGWKNRNMVVRQWILQDFKKTTDMTVDEVQTALNGLGDKLNRGESAAQYVKPLTQLVKYYEHQLSEMKGFQKVSRRQTENIEMTSGWIKDVRSLMEALSKLSPSSGRSSPDAANPK